MAQNLQNELRLRGIYAELNLKNESLNKRIRTAEKQKVPMIVLIGNKELNNNSLAIRDRRTKTDSGENMQYEMALQNFLEKTSNLHREVSF